MHRILSGSGPFGRRVLASLFGAILLLASGAAQASDDRPAASSGSATPVLPTGIESPLGVAGTAKAMGSRGDRPDDPAAGTQLATLWLFAKCGAHQVKTPDGCVCEPGFTFERSLCRPVAAAPAPEKPRQRAAAPVRPRKVAPQPVVDGVAGFDGRGRPCIDGDLFDLVTATYGRKAGLRACTAGCIPRPSGTLRSSGELDRLARASGVAWCPESCIALTGYLPPAEVLRLERITGRTFCPVNGRDLCRAPDVATLPIAATVERVLALSSTAAPAPRTAGDVAVVLGFDGYRSPLPAGTHGRRDAEAVKALLADRLGYARENVILAVDLSAADLRKLLGPDGDLARRKPTDSIFLYVSGHGLSDPATGAAYLLPVDADPARLAETALSLQEVYEALGTFGAKAIVVALEASFPSGLADLIDPPNLPESDVAVLPARAIPGLSVFTAADRDQRTLADPEFGTGLFTRYLLEGLAGAADAEPTGNGDRKIESVELYVFTAHRVRVSARKSFGLEQKPLISESGNALVRSF